METKVRAAGGAPRAAIFTYVSLFTSLGTLLCCALPSLLVLFGFGATMAAVLSAAPWLVGLSRHKLWVFLAAGLCLAASFFYVYGLGPRLRTGHAACPPDAVVCEVAGRFSRIVLWLSGAIYLVGFFTAFVLGRLL
jgi:mercuric ion transport protein